MPVIVSRKGMIRNAILVIIILLLSVGSLSLIFRPNYGCGVIDEQADWVSFTYHANAGGVDFHYHTGHENRQIWMEIAEPGSYNITYHYFNGSTGNVKFTVCEVANFTFSPYFDRPLQGEWADGWVVDHSNETMTSYSFIRKEGFFEVPYCSERDLEKIEVNGDVGYFTTSWEDIEVDTGKFL